MVILAHMGGIDEIGIFVIPALLAIWALRWAERRARQEGQAGEVAGEAKDGEAKEARDSGEGPSGFKLTAR